MSLSNALLDLTEQLRLSASPKILDMRAGLSAADIRGSLEEHGISSGPDIESWYEWADGFVDDRSTAVGDWFFPSLQSALTNRTEDQRLSLPRGSKWLGVMVSSPVVLAIDCESSVLHHCDDTQGQPQAVGRLEDAVRALNKAMSNGDYVWNERIHGWDLLEGLMVPGAYPWWF